MRVAAKAGQDMLEWSILDVDQDEWERRLADLGVAAAANGIPVYPAAPRKVAEQIPAAPTAQSVARRLPRRMRQILPVIALLTLMGGLAGGAASYGVWRRAQEGVALMQGDVANAVKLEMVRTHTAQAAHIQEDVQTVTLQGDKAMAAVIVTRTLPAGQVVARVETRFYLLTAKGWQRARPQAEFWGPSETLATASLHFVFGSADRGIVEQMAPRAEALYATLRLATGQSMASGDLLTIELVPDGLVNDEQAGAGGIRLASPAFASRSVRLPREDIFILLQLRHALAGKLLDAAVQKNTPKAQWATMVMALGAWLQFSTRVQPSPPSEIAALPQLGAGMLRLEDLFDGETRNATADQSRAYQADLMAAWQEQREAAAEQLIDYIAGVYGIDALARLLLGFAQYNDWEELAPAAFGVSAAELEEGWHTDMREGASMRASY